LRVRRFLRIALACEIEAIAAAVLAAALVAIVLLVDQSAELHYTIHATVSGCLSDSAGGNSTARPDSERADAQNGETTVHLVRTVSPRAFLFDPSGSQAERVNTFETVGSRVHCHFRPSVIGVGAFEISFRPGALGKFTTDAGSGLIDTLSGGALARGAPLTKRSGWRR